MNVPDALRYTATHEWVRQETDGTLTVGITDHAQDSLGEIVFVDVPPPGRRVAAGESCAVVESVKAASDIYAPVPGEIVASNTELAGEPGAVNRDPYGAWLFRVRPAPGADLGTLMDAAGYRASIGAA
ncbi:MAG: glycine cleavage system protein GcvH [Burkholderiales bacterium]|nr:glycine cleavage system protein GcvH [Burkholderiales bacterium]